ncbi:WhiB family transcriptional regulator [Streptodolium elevatio]|uniref:WhiB family transcriptional regulator n=1 Tax=Streptodolium elevatio TaxID=3157996 RepID=A0ABV3DG00_9ACTN
MPEPSDLTSSLQDVAAPAERSSTWIPPATGACRSELQLFVDIPEEPAVARIAREEDAKRICARCAVLIECRAEALAASDAEPAGVRGGLTLEERQAIARRRRRRGGRRATGR